MRKEIELKMEFVREEGAGVNKVQVYQLEEESRLAYVALHPIEPKDRTEEWR